MPHSVSLEILFQEVVKFHIHAINVTMLHEVIKISFGPVCRRRAREPRPSSSTRLSTGSWDAESSRSSSRQHARYAHQSAERAVRACLSFFSDAHVHTSHSTRQTRVQAYALQSVALRGCLQVALFLFHGKLSTKTLCIYVILSQSSGVEPFFRCKTEALCKLYLTVWCSKNPSVCKWSKK